MGNEGRKECTDSQLTVGSLSLYIHETKMTNTWKMVVETIGKTVYKKMVQVCMAFEDIAASAASRSSGLDRKMRCRRTNHAVVAKSLVRKKCKATTQDKTRLHRCQQ